MKIIEALKELPLLEKRINKNAENLQIYSSGIDNGEGKFQFGTQADQEREVAALVQSTNDLVARRAKIRRALSLTNATVAVTIDGQSKTITEWIEYRKSGIDMQIKALQALNQNSCQAQLRNQNVDLNKGLRTVQFYDEKSKLDGITQLMTLKDHIDPSLEIVNATTDLIEPIAALAA